MLPNVTEVEVSKEKQTATISMDKHIALSVFQNALGKKYTIETADHNETAEQAKSWFSTYKPILLIFLYITVIVVIAAAEHTGFNWMHGMNVFMAGFFSLFRSLKCLI